MWSFTRLTSLISAATRYKPFIWMLLSRIGISRFEWVSISFIYEPRRYNFTSGDRNFYMRESYDFEVLTLHSKIPSWLARYVGGAVFSWYVLKLFFVSTCIVWTAMRELRQSSEFNAISLFSTGTIAVCVWVVFNFC